MIRANALLFTVALGLTAGVVTVSMSQTPDVFAFIPDGGRTLLADLLDSGLPPDAQSSLASETRDSAGWLAFLDEQSTTVPGIAALDEYQRQTLADYLRYNAPLDGDVPLATDTLPMDGRDMTLRYCQSCHIVTVVITQSRAREAWLGTLHKPSHIEVDLTEEQREALSDYLVVNAGIPIEEVPPELRAGGASY
jgi:hypothetical protein